MNEIKELIKQKDSSIDEQTLYYFTNYFYVIIKENLIPDGISLDELISNALKYKNIVFYDENHPKYEKLGKDVKGERDPKTQTLYIRDNLEEPLKEMVIYHELHHAVQTNPETNQVGINQDGKIGRLIMEAQTQYVAERIYSEVHGIEFEERKIPSEKLRMQEGGTIISSLHNYEQYDQILTKLAIFLGVDKEYFVKINYLYKDAKGLKELESKYNEMKELCGLNRSFEDFMYMIDYIYITDYMAYLDNSDKETILSGKETENRYLIYENKAEKLSLERQYLYQERLDLVMYDAVRQNGGDYKTILKYFVDDMFRDALYKELETTQGQR